MSLQQKKKGLFVHMLLPYVAIKCSEQSASRAKVEAAERLQVRPHPSVIRSDSDVESVRRQIRVVDGSNNTVQFLRCNESTLLAATATRNS